MITTTVGEFCPFKYGKSLAANKRVAGEISVYGSNGRVGFHNEALVNSHGIIIGRCGSIGLLHISKDPFWPIDSSFHVVRDDYYETVYTYYLLKSLGLESMISGSAVPSLNRDKAHALKIQILECQKDRVETGRLISLFDDKIEINRRMNETLEEMVREIFKSWFVDFDPVRAKIAGNQPAHMDIETAALFPSSFGDDGLPDGWAEKQLYSSASFVNGAAYKNMYFCAKSDGLPVVKIAELKRGITSQTKYTNTDLGDKYRISSGDIFFAWSGSPQTSINTFIWVNGDGWLNQHIFAVRENGFASEVYLYCQMKALNSQFIQIAMDKQTTGLGHVTVKDMKEIAVVSAPNPLKDRFDLKAKPIFEKIKYNLFENQTLAKLRDTLLPKLMSGEVRVKDAKPAVEAVV